jgi:riboflavin synthase
MFSGIVNGFYVVSNIINEKFFQTFSVSLPDELTKGLNIGASVAINGVCMTVTKIKGADVYFDAMKETLDVTTIGILRKGSNVNVERSIKYGDEIGGHTVSGHVHGTAKVIKVDRTYENNCFVDLLVSSQNIKYLFKKGFVALNGASLTVVDVDKKENIIRVSFIPETLRMTTFGMIQEDEHVNIEIDSQTQSIVDTVNEYLNDNVTQQIVEKNA